MRNIDFKRKETEFDYQNAAHVEEFGLKGFIKGIKKNEKATKLRLKLNLKTLRSLK